MAPAVRSWACRPLTRLSPPASGNLRRRTRLARPRPRGPAAAAARESCRTSPPESCGRFAAHPRTAGGPRAPPSRRTRHPAQCSRRRPRDRAGTPAPAQRDCIQMMHLDFVSLEEHGARRIAAASHHVVVQERQRLCGAASHRLQIHVSTNFEYRARRDANAGDHVIVPVPVCAYSGMCTCPCNMCDRTTGS